MIELGRIAVLMREEITPECLGLMAEELVEFEPGRLAHAFGEIRRKAKFFPRVSEVIGRLPLEPWKPEDGE